MMRLKISKATLMPGWAEVRMTMQRPVPDSPDFKLFDDEARVKMVKTMVAFVAGVAHQLGDFEFEGECIAFAKRVGLI